MGALLYIMDYGRRRTAKKASFRDMPIPMMCRLLQ